MGKGFYLSAKKCLGLLIALVLMLSTVITPMAASPVGDLNGDDTVSAPDLSTLTIVLLQDIEDIQYDVNGDGVIDIRDLIRLKKILAFAKVTVSAPVEPVDNKVPAGGITLSGGGVTAFVPEGVLLEDGVSELVLTVTPLISLSGELSVGDSETMSPYDVHISGISKENTIPVIIDLGVVMPKFLNMGNYKIYHVENGENVLMTLVSSREELTAHNQFTYEPETGKVTVAMATFSELAMIADTVNAWNGYNADFSWYDSTKTDLTIANADQLAALSAIVGGMNGQTQDSFKGKTIKLLSNINLGDAEKSNDANKIFYPIGYYSSDGIYEKTGKSITSGFYTFEGTFDGNGHTISNIYQNTWEMKGDNNYYDATLQYYRDGMGLFGKVYGGTVKNLTVDNFTSDGEYTTTGVIAAYADGATFENIAITNCNPRVYNIGNGGIVGCVGWYAKDADLKTTFKNITVDNSNKISALWGSWDVACGGIVGQYYPTSGQTSAGTPKNAGIHFDNCHVSAQMDVYNDVCANYQYYAYRYTGMMIGSIRENETIDGHVYPKMDGITASGCTVHFGDWNDYYYCELVANSLASYTHDHQFSRLEQVKAINGTIITYLDGTTGTVPTSGSANYVVVNENGHTTENATCYHFVNGEVWEHKDGGYETTDIDGDGVIDSDTLKEDKNHIYLEFNNLFTGYGWGVTSKGVDDIDGVTILDRVIANSEKKFTTVYPGDDEETGEVSYQMRVGNQNAVAMSSLFDTKGGAIINESGVTVSIDKLDKDIDVSGTYTPGNSSWKDGTIKFDGSGVLKITIQDYEYCIPTVLYVEVVDAVNITTNPGTINGEAKVLLNDISNGFTIDNGGILYGNGFKAKCSGDGSYKSAALSYAYVYVKNGSILDNIQVICDIFPESYLYTSEMKAGSDGRYPYGYSAVIIEDATISNCYIYGARNNIFVPSGNATVENTVTECGSLANIQIKGTDANTITLKDVTTIQYQTTSSYDTSKKVLGFGVVVGTNESESNPKIILKGDFKQYNWVTGSDTSVSNKYAQTAIEEALEVEAYKHIINDTDTVNMGVAYLNGLNAEISDERDNKNVIPYELTSITMLSQTGKVYSIANSSITSDSRYNAKVDKVIPYSPIMNRNITPDVSFEDANAALTLNCTNTYEKGRTYKLSIDLDNISGGAYSFNFNDIKIYKYGKELTFNAKDLDGNTVDKNTTVNFNQLQTKEYTLEVEDNLIYNINGTVSDKIEIHTIPFIVNATKTSIDPPKFTNAGTATAIRLVTSKGGDWRPAYTVLTGVSVTYWSASESKVKTVDLSTLYNSGTISSNVWTYTCDDYTLTITGGAVHSDGTTITPVVANNTLYFASTNKAFGTGTTSRNIILTYVFTDKNASATWNRTETVTYSNLSEYDYNSFKNNGTLTEPSSGGGLPCVTPDTFVTLADGSQKRIDEVTYDDMLLVWDFYKGEYASAPSSIVMNHGYNNYSVLTLNFEDGTTINTINGHGFFDVSTNEFIILNTNNVVDYLGHDFVKTNGEEYSTVKLVDYSISQEYTESWSILTAEHYNCVLEGMWTLTPAEVEGSPEYLMPYEINDDMKYDEAKMQADIEKYGLYTYDDFAEYMTYEQFSALNLANFKVSVGKGYITWDDIITLINIHIG